MKNLLRHAFDFEPRWYVVFIFFLTGIFFGGITTITWIFNGNMPGGFERIGTGSADSYRFISPLRVVSADQKNFFENKNLEQGVAKSISEHIAQGSITRASFYFRDLEDPGRWSGVNENDAFKVPRPLSLVLMVAYLRDAEDNPSLLQEALVYQGFGVQQSSSLEYGKSYSIENLIHAMIVEQNPGATGLLYERIDKNSLSDIYSDLGIAFDESSNFEDELTMKEYALILRVLYHASYLGRTYSEKALALLSQIPRAVGITAKLPNDVESAHFFQARSAVYGARGLQVHHCGITYLEKRPYVLCVGVEGVDHELLDSTLREIGGIVYKHAIDTLFIQRDNEESGENEE